MANDPASALQELGLLAAEAHVYLALVRNGALSGTAAASVTGYPRSSVYLTLNSLLHKGLIEGGHGHGSRFFVVPPDKALPSLVMQEKEAIAQREKIAAQLGRRLASLLEPTETTPDKLIQVIRSPRGVAERYERLQLEARRSNEVFVKAPFFVAPGNPVQEKANRDGVRVRAIYERAVLDVAAVKPYLAKWIALGEQVRIYDGKLPHKLAIFDRKRALVHLTMPGDQMRTLYIDHPELAVSLGVAFDALWERSKPLGNADRKSLPRIRSQVAYENPRAALRQAVSENEKPAQIILQTRKSTKMKKSTSKSAFFSVRVLVSLVAMLAGVFLAVLATSGQIKRPKPPIKRSASSGVQQEWVAMYNGGYGPDIAGAIALDALGNVYVTGSSVGAGTCSLACIDYATLKYDASGTQEWVARYNGPASDSDQASAIAVDASGNVYVTGSSIGTAWPDYDYATIKYNSSGQQQWVARYSGPGNDLDFGNAIAVDESGNVYVTGASFGSGTGFDYATVKYDSSGHQQWVARYDGPGDGDDEAYAIAIDTSGNVYVTGYSAGSGTTNDYATIKYDSSGQQQWVARYDGPTNANDYANAIAVDSLGNVYVTGFSDNSGFDYATIKYDSSGQQQWAARYNGPANDDDEASAISVDGSGNVYVTGYSVGSGTQEDYATIKYNASGTEEWVARYNGQANFNDDAHAIAVDAAGNVYVTGWSVGSGTGYDYATVKYDNSGAEQWVARYDGPASVDDQSYAVAVDASGNVCVTGYSTVDSKTGRTDYTTIKYSQAPSPSPTPIASPTPTATPTATPRTTATPRPRPTPAPRPSPRQ